MVKTLKDENKSTLFLLLAANLAAFYLFAETGQLLVGDWIALLNDWQKAIPSGIALVLTGILNAQLSADVKARLVFWRWKDPLPGCRAFTFHAPRDPRINLTAIEQEHGTLPLEPKKQNALWYRLYKSVETDRSVEQAHRDFLLSRDYASILVLVFFVLGVAGYLQFESLKTLLFYLSLVGVQFVLACRAAQNNGHRLVTTVLALKGAGR